MTKKQKLTLARIALSGLIFLVLMLFAAGGKINLILFLIPYLIVGYDVIFEALKNVLSQPLDEHFLMSVATIGAIVLGEYPEALAVMLFYQIGELFQDIAVTKSRKSIASLMDIRPDCANVFRGDTEFRVEPSEVENGEIIIVRPGERIPLDGSVIEGFCSVDTSALTGESVPREIKIGDQAVSGCVNLNGVIKIKVSGVYEDSTVSRILELVENSASKKTKTEAFITKFARVYTPMVVIAALILAILPPLVFGGVWSEWIRRGLIFLVVSCPCALVISVPLGFFGGIGNASKRGILIKGSGYMENLAKADTFVFDKTGTLTKGVFEVTAIHESDFDKNKLLELAAYAESNSNHPIARSVVSKYNKAINQNRIGNVREVAGKGIVAEVDSHCVAVGNSKLMKDISSEYHDCHKTGTVLHIAMDSRYLGHIVISDVIKDNSVKAISGLRSLGVSKCVMLTGDRKETAESVAKTIGVDEVKSELMPENKVFEVEKLLDKNKKGKLVFVGDGINDAAVLARADVGVAMGVLGSDAAIEAADVVLMDDDPAKLCKAVSISRFTISIVKQNIFFALFVKGMVLLLGALGFANMWIAVFADVGVSIIAILNSLRVMVSKN